MSFMKVEGMSELLIWIVQVYLMKLEMELERSEIYFSLDEPKQ